MGRGFPVSVPIRYSLTFGVLLTIGGLGAFIKEKLNASYMLRKLMIDHESLPLWLDRKEGLIDFK